MIALTSEGDIGLTDSTISAAVSGGSKPGGNITVSAGGHLVLADGSEICAQSDGMGDAGNITLAARERFVSTDSKITTHATQASGGNISVRADDMVHVKNSQLNASLAGSDQTVGGSIFIDPQFVIFQNSQIVANATAGRGGNINIIASAFLTDPNSTVSASSDTGISGSVNVRAPVILSGTLLQLSQGLLQAEPLLMQRCAARLPGGQFSSFVVAGRDGLPAQPGGWLTGSTAMADRAALPAAGTLFALQDHSPSFLVSEIFPLPGWDDECPQR